MSDSTCGIDDCGRPAVARGMCGRHYNRAYRAGTLPKRVPRVVDIDEASGTGTCRTHGPNSRLRVRARAGGNVYMCRKCDRGPNSSEARRHSKRRSYIRAYGIEPEEYRAMLQAQGGRCAICREVPTTKNLGIDHDHQTGAVRGLLCSPCNLAIGSLRDDPLIVDSAARYLRATRA